MSDQHVGQVAPRNGIVLDEWLIRGLERRMVFDLAGGQGATEEDRLKIPASHARQHQAGLGAETKPRVIAWLAEHDTPGCAQCTQP